jgi:opacity protein-like surface antigen
MASPTSAQVRGFADLGVTTFTAKESVETVLGSSSGLVFGGGVEVTLPANLFATVRASRFRADGERVFVFNGEVFNLGIPATVTITPVEFTGGYRFDRGQRTVPYVGGGVGLHRYEETSAFADDDENVKESFTGYHVLGGVEFRATRLIALGGEAQWTTVPDALGQDANSVASQFDESDLGGVSFRVKVVIGR